MTAQVAVPLPEDLVDRLDALVPGTHASRSEAVRRAIELYLHRIAAERDAELYAEIPMTDIELSLVDDPDGWSTTAPW